MDIRNSIVGIVAKSSSEKKFSGTGFFVEGGFILTCAHVVDQAQITDDKVQFRIEGKKPFYDAEILYKSPETELDICILQPIGLDEEVPPLPLVMSRQSGGNKFKTFGYPQPTGFQGLHGDGEILGWVRDARERDALHISSDEVKQGYSGCPVVDDKAGGVIGMVSRGFDFGLDKKLGTAVFAIPSEVLKLAYSELVVSEIATPEPIQAWNLKHPYAMPPNFTGRLAERKMLVDWLQNDDENRLFILCALGGFGKSALVWHWLTYDVDSKDWPKLVWWSFYEGDASFENFIRETLEYLEVEVPQGQRTQVDELLKALQTQKILLIMDGFERALRAYSSMNAAYQSDEEQDEEETSQRDCVNINAEVFLKNLCALPNLKGKVLMTTRLTPRAVEQRGELLKGCYEEELNAMQKNDTVEFFHKLEINGTRAEIETACEPYGYHPFSLRILAGLIVDDRESPGDIGVAGKLDITKDVIQNKHHVLEVAYNTLSPEQQKLLSNIACFRSAMTYEALKAFSDKDISPDLQMLEQRGLLHWDKTTNKYDLHPIVRRYAYERLTAPDQTAAHERLANYFEAVPKPEKVEKLEDLAPVIELYHHMVRAGNLDEASDLFYDRISKPTHFQFGAYQLRIELLRALFPDGEDKPPHLKKESDQAWAINELAITYSSSGQPRHAAPLKQLAVNFFEELTDKQNISATLVNLTIEQIYIGALSAAERNLRRQIDLCSEIENEGMEGTGHYELGKVLVYIGQWEEAKRALNTGEEIKKKTNHIQAQSLIWSYRALRFLLMARESVISNQLPVNNVKSAIECAQRALELADESSRLNTPTPRDYVDAHRILGAAYRMNRELNKAEENLSKAISFCRQINSVDAEADILLELAKLRFTQKKPEEAKALAEEALLITERSGYVLQGADVHLFLAQFTLEQEKDEDKAKELAERARELAYCDGGEYKYKVAYEEAERFLEKL